MFYYSNMIDYIEIIRLLERKVSRSQKFWQQIQRKMFILTIISLNEET